MKTLQKRRTVFGIIIMTLLLCDLASLAVLFSRLDYYSTGFKNVIPLTESNGFTMVKSSRQNALSLGDSSVRSLSYSEDGDVSIWETETEAEIFKFSYDSENGTTVQTVDGTDKLIAPGTSNEYTFTLENTGSTLLDYTLTMEAYVTGTDYTLPVKVSVSDYTGKYILGSETDKVDVLELNNVKEESKLSEGRFAVYTLKWEWAYESGNDEYDTMLGNLAVDDDIVLTIKINTIASYDDGILPSVTSRGEDDIVIPPSMVTKEVTTTTPAVTTSIVPNEDDHQDSVSNSEETQTVVTTVVEEEEVTETIEFAYTEESSVSTVTNTTTNDTTTSNGIGKTVTATTQTFTTTQITTDTQTYGLEGYSTNPHTGDSSGIGVIVLILTLSLVVTVLAKPKDIKEYSHEEE